MSNRGNIVGNDFFKFKKFIVNQANSAMRVNTDGVILGAWMSLIPTDKKLLDIGTGTGVIALMAAQRVQKLRSDFKQLQPSDKQMICKTINENDFMIYGIDSDEFSYSDAQKNFENSSWRNNLIAENITFQEFSIMCAPKFDLIFSNPPYFTNSLKSQYKERSDARHNNNLSQSDLIKGTKECLRDGGRFALILPTEEANEFLNKINFLKKRVLASGSGDCFLQLARKCSVSYKAEDEPQRIMMEFIYTPAGPVGKLINIHEEKLIVMKNGTYSNDYKKLTKEFYLNF